MREAFSIIKNKKIIIGLVIVLVIATGWSFGKYVNKLNKEEKYKILRTAANNYLESKYNEKMVMIEGYSYYDNVYLLYAHPEDHKEIIFKVEISVYRSKLKDNYLARCAEKQVQKAIESIVNEKTQDCRNILAILLDSEEAEEALKNYYELNQEPMGSYNEDMPNEIERAAINLNSKGDAQDYETVCSIVKDIPLLSFTIERLNFYIYNDGGKVIKKYSFNLVEGEYVEQ